jgi:hypothetical protein
MATIGCTGLGQALTARVTEGMTLIDSEDIFTTMMNPGRR